MGWKETKEKQVLMLMFDMVARMSPLPTNNPPRSLPTPLLSPARRSERLLSADGVLVDGRVRLRGGGDEGGESDSHELVKDVF